MKNKDPEITTYLGDSFERLRNIPGNSVHCVVTSPPYWGLRSYGEEPGMIGLEPTFEEHLENLLEVFDEVKRVLRDDGTLWLNYGDAYSTKPNGQKVAEKVGDDRAFRDKPMDTTNFLKPKNLMMMPARIAIALQEQGWILRSEIIWHKPNPMPESVTDRPTSAHEKIFLFSKKAKYYYDADAVRYKTRSISGARGSNRKRNPTDKISGIRSNEAREDLSANLRNVLTIPVHGFTKAHFATFPPKLIKPCIKAGTSEKGVCSECGAPYVRQIEKQPSSMNIRVRDAKAGRLKSDFRGTDAATEAEKDSYGTETSGHRKTLGWQPTCSCEAEVIPATVLDPSFGAGTTSLVSAKLGRNSIGIEISPEYLAIAKERILGELGPLFLKWKEK